jgi:hypothetical protein
MKLLTDMLVETTFTNQIGDCNNCVFDNNEHYTLDTYTNINEETKFSYLSYFIYLISTTLKIINGLLLINPVKNVYLKGPKILGLWGGDELHDICARLSGGESSFWSRNISECKGIINKHFESYYVFISTILYLMVLYKFIYFVWWRYFIIKPIMNQINNLIKEHLIMVNNG